ncbi:MerR family transcriptional regulator [Salinisphaera aquimarina]|uniref:Mercuric resistance operon regulatory protein n=1 Tax=Salinisphaera aquimarina TaxID=2094031 RepID=A0ABV7ENB9_9GAMM
MRIGELAQRSGIGVETVRFYEREGLLPEPARGANGYRRYTADSSDRLVFIVRAKRLGFTLAEIRELLTLQDGQGSRAQVMALAEHKLGEIDARLADLQRMRETLGDLAQRCAGHGDIRSCPIISALAGAGEEPPEPRVTENESGT